MTLLGAVVDLTGVHARAAPGGLGTYAEVFTFASY